MIINTFRYPFAKIPTEQKNISLPELKPISIERFIKGLSIPTVSKANYTETNFKPFEDYLKLLEEEYPQIFEIMTKERVNQYALVLHWKGKSNELKPILFLAHLDVVAAGDEKGWKFNPFRAEAKDGRIFGRGTLDMKNMLHGVLEACDELIENNYTPERDIYLAFGHDEEVGGREGAVKIAEHLQMKGLQFEAIFDEGGITAEKGSLNGINAEVAMIGVAEKGFIASKIKVKGKGGHSSMPPLESAMGNAAKIMVDLEKNQMPSRLTPIIQNFFDNVGGSMSFLARFSIANQWIMKPILLRQMANSPSSNAITRTTTALTMMKGSEGTNVISPEVEFVVNFRILPGDTVEDVRKHIEKATRNYEVTTEEVSNTRNASIVSSTNTPVYKSLEKVVQTLFPNAIVTPYITIGGTDAFKYEKLSQNIFRFNPILLDSEERASIHNFNESIRVENFQRTIHYYRLLIHELNQN